MQDRTSRVQRLMERGATRTQVLAFAKKQWKASSTTTDRYILRVRERWIADRTADAPTDREQTIVRLRKLAKKLERGEAWSPLVQVERLVADILGVRAPERHEHAVAAVITTTQVLPDDVLASLSDAFLEELERVAERRLIEAPDRSAVIDVPSDD